MYGYLRGIVNITCEAEAEPPAKFTWYRDDKELSPKHHFIHTQGHESVLQVRFCLFSILFYTIMLYERSIFLLGYSNGCACIAYCKYEYVRVLSDIYIRMEG